MEPITSCGLSGQVVTHHALVAIVLVGAVAISAVSARAQSVAPRPASPTGALRVWLSCPTCDLDSVKAGIGFVEFTADATTADVEVVVTDERAERRWRLTFVGRGRFTGRDRMLSFSTAAFGTINEMRRELARVLKLGLVEYAAETAAGPHLDVTIRRLPAAPPSMPIVDIEGPELNVTVRGLPQVPASPAQEDGWNHWVFHLNGDADSSAEQTSFSTTYNAGTSANRTTEGWKLRVGGSRSLNRSSFTVSDDETIRSRLADWNTEALIVKSVGAHFSVGVTASVSGSTYSNEKRVARVSPGIEYDLFPYEESTRRSLTLLYSAGRSYYEYEAETVFGKLTEEVAHHTFDVSLGLRQPWGQAGGRLIATQQLTARDRTRATFLGNLSVRLTRNLSVTASGSYSRIRDQFTLEKGDATEEEVLLRLRQLATGHRYSASVGLTFSFGALSNATVNPRFSR